MIKKIEPSYLSYLDANNLYGCEMSQKLPVNRFKQENNLSRYNEDFIKNYDENSEEGYFLEMDIKTYHFYLIEKNQEKQKNLFVPQKTRKNILYI